MTAALYAAHGWLWPVRINAFTWENTHILYQASFLSGEIFFNGVKSAQEALLLSSTGGWRAGLNPLCHVHFINVDMKGSSSLAGTQSEQLWWDSVHPTAGSSSLEVKWCTCFILVSQREGKQHLQICSLLRNIHVHKFSLKFFTSWVFLLPLNFDWCYFCLFNA